MLIHTLEKMFSASSSWILSDGEWENGSWILTWSGDEVRGYVTYEESGCEI
jgi:hypothetical protein